MAQDANTRKVHSHTDEPPVPNRELGKREPSVREAVGDAVNASLDRMAGRLASADDSEQMAEAPSTHAPSDAHRSSSTKIDRELIQETRLQIRELVQEISQLSESDCELDQFMEGFVSRLTSALASVGAAIWLLDGDEQPELQYATNLPESICDDAPTMRSHRLLLGRLIEGGEAVLVPPSSGVQEEDAAGNPTPNLLVIAPIRVDREVVGLVEVFQRSGTGPTTQRGYLRFLAQMCELASGYFKNRRLRQFRDQQQLWGRLDQFIHAAHSSLDVTNISFQIVNEGRRVLDCDRLSVATCFQGRTTIRAVSGLDSLDRRAPDLKLLTRLTHTAIRTREPIWYTGDRRDLPPQIEKILDEYLDRTHCKLLGIVPLVHDNRPAENGDLSGHAPSQTDEDVETLGALIVEQLTGEADAKRLEANANVLAGHVTDAYANVREIDRVPFIAVWRLIGRMSWLTQARNLPVSGTIAALLIGVIAALCIVPADFELASDGTLTPATRHDVFAPIGGTVKAVHLPENNLELIQPDAVLLELENRALEVELNDLIGQEQNLMTRADSLQRSLVEQNSQLTAIDEIRLETELIEIEQSLITVRRKIEIRQIELNDLVVRSPALGQVGDWQARSRLERRPVQQGQKLVSLVDPTGQWEVELEVPEKQVGHLMKAQRDQSEPLSVTFILASDPARQFVGEVQHVHMSAEVRESQQNVVLVKVAFDKSQIPEELRRHGTRVRARIDCGSRPAGYVLFHDVIETVQSRVMFWF